MITVVVGAQYGSEGKGVIVSELAKRGGWDAMVRVGAPNAGHSHQAFGKKWAQRMLPVGWAHDLNAKLILGAGAVVDTEILGQEVKAAMDYDPSLVDRVFVDWRATKLTPHHREVEGKTKGALWRKIGSTGEGVGEARKNRMCRSWDSPALVGRIDNGYFRPANTVDMLHTMEHILIEGTQGAGLSMTHGDWPYVTTCDPNVSGILADCGIPPTRDIQTILVARTFPIRVAGNSGPMYNELSWGELSTRIGKAVVEQTTVTKLVRRVGEWDDELFDKAIKLNDPESVVLTFMDYIDPSLEGTPSWDAVWKSDRAREFINSVEDKHGVEVVAVGTGGPKWSVAWRHE